MQMEKRPRKTRQRAKNLLGNSQNVQVQLVNDVQQFYNSSKHDTAAFQQLPSLHGITPEAASLDVKRRSANQSENSSTKLTENSETGSRTGSGENSGKQKDGSTANSEQPGKDLEASETDKPTPEQIINSLNLHMGEKIIDSAVAADPTDLESLPTTVRATKPESRTSVKARHRLTMRDASG